MTLQSIFAFVLVLAAVAFAALAWITSLRLRLEAELFRSTTNNNLTKLSARLATLTENVSKLRAAAPSTLAAEVAELSAAVAKLAKTQQRFAGKVWAEKYHESNGSGRSDDVSALDPELAAELALQTAPPVAPGRS